MHGLRADLKFISTPSKSLPLSFPLLQSLSFERAAAVESSHLLLLLVTQQPGLLSKLQELDLSSCKVSLGARLARAMLMPPGWRLHLFSGSNCRNPLCGSLCASSEAATSSLQQRWCAK